MLRLLQRLGVSKGVFGASKPWLIIGAAAWTVRRVGRITRRQPEVVYCEPLGEGEAIVIAHGPQASVRH